MYCTAPLSHRKGRLISFHDDDDDDDDCAYHRWRLSSSDLSSPSVESRSEDFDLRCVTEFLGSNEKCMRCVAVCYVALRYQLLEIGL